MRTLPSGILALIGGVVAMAPAVSLLTVSGDAMMGTSPGALYAGLLLALGLIVFGNGVLLLFGRPLPGQGAIMALYGGLMLLVGSAMLFTDVFSMTMTMGAASGVAMYLVGGAMLVSGAVMLTRPTM